MAWPWFLVLLAHARGIDMGRRSKILTLPPQVLEELNARLVQGGFQDYSGLSVWLAESGFVISKTAIHVHGKGLEDEFNAAMADARRTRALAIAAKESGSDNGATMSAASEILQNQLLRISIALRQADLEPEEAARTLSQVSRSFADIGRMTISHQKWLAEIREKTEAAAAAVDKVVKSSGLSDDVAETIRQRILGIV